MTLILNSLGGYEPKATVYMQVTPAETAWTSEGKVERLARQTAVVRSVSAGVGGQYETFEAALAAMIAVGWRVVDQGLDPSNRPRATIEHVETARRHAAQVAADADEWRDAKPCFVRFGPLPAAGRSRNHADGALEAGVSVYRGQRLRDGRARVEPRTNAEIVGHLYLAADARQLYIVAGREIGVGSDGEPLLADCRILKKAK